MGRQGWNGLASKSIKQSQELSLPFHMYAKPIADKPTGNAIWIVFKTKFNAFAADFRDAASGHHEAVRRLV